LTAPYPIAAAAVQCEAVDCACVCVDSVAVQKCYKARLSFKQVCLGLHVVTGAAPEQNSDSDKLLVLLMVDTTEYCKYRII
jgi:hypothetical protein